MTKGVRGGVSGAGCLEADVPVLEAWWACGSILISLELLDPGGGGVGGGYRLAMTKGTNHCDRICGCTAVGEHSILNLSLRSLAQQSCLGCTLTVPSTAMRFGIMVEVPNNDPGLNLNC